MPHQCGTSSKARSSGIFGDLHIQTALNDEWRDGDASGRPSNSKNFGVGNIRIDIRLYMTARVTGSVKNAWILFWLITWETVLRCGLHDTFWKSRKYHYLPPRRTRQPQRFNVVMILHTSVTLSRFAVIGVYRAVPSAEKAFLLVAVSKSFHNAKYSTNSLLCGSSRVCRWRGVLGCSDLNCGSSQL